MAEGKIFAGPRIRRLRNARGLTQTAMAAGLGISPSYLNLIERNQRPLTVQLILRLASVYKVDAEELQGEAGASVAALREVFADPLLAGELPGDQEMIELAEAAPNAAAAVLKLYRAYREQGERMSDLGAMLSAEGRETAVARTRLPMDEVREELERRSAFWPGIEERTEAFRSELPAGDDLHAALTDWLKSVAGVAVKVLPVSAMPNWRRRYDRHTQRLFISERLSPQDRLREIAMEAALLKMGPAMAEEVRALPLSSDEARRIARFELARYAAHALMMPYSDFLSAAQRSRYDLDVLHTRFGVSFEQAASRLVTLARTDAAGAPFFLMEVDEAGNRIRRAGAQGFPHARFGGGCPKLAVHAIFAQPGRIHVEAVETPEGERFLTLARTLEGLQGAFSERPRRTALLLGCDMGAAGHLVYSDVLPAVAPPVAIGRGCRLCERPGCLSRAEPPVTRPLGLDEMVTGLSAFDFQ